MKTHALIPAGTHAAAPAARGPAPRPASPQVRQILHGPVRNGGGADVIRRQTIHATCAGQDGILREAWAEGQRMATQTADTLDGVMDTMRAGVSPAPSIARLIENNFGSDVGLVPGGYTRLSDLISRFRRIADGFAAGRTLRCDTASAESGDDQCGDFAAFVVPGNRTDVFICPAFFGADVTPVSRGVTLVHEMAHSVLGIAHRGGQAVTIGCDTAFAWDYSTAKLNAYPYGILANCLHGQGLTEAGVVPTRRPAAPAAARDPRWSLSASAGAELRPSVSRFAGVLGGRYSIRSGQLVVFNPVIGLNVLYLPPGAQPEHVVAATVDIGLRIQQPLRGVYLDVSGGGLAGFTVNPAAGTRPTAGFTAAAGVGYRLERLELGAEARGLFPLTAGDSSSLLILGRIGVRF